MRWPWKRRTPPKPPVPDTPGQPPSGDLRRAREAARSAAETLDRARSQRPVVAAAGRDIQRTLNRNHLAELVRGALGSGGGST